MKYQRLFLLCCIFMASLFASSSNACTTFCLDTHDDLVVGKNFDWVFGDALIVVNKRNVTKTAYPWTGEQPAAWTSKYGSVTVNFLGREFPFNGMNEAGLFVGGMNLSQTEYPALDSRPAMIALQWIQYQLDTAATVAEVISSDLEIRIINYQTGAHFFVCDSQGNCASIEYLDGVLVVHQTAQETMPVKVQANTVYAEDLDYWEKKELPPDRAWSTGRFFTAAQMLEDYDSATSGPAIDYTFTILSNLRWFVPTQWSIAYDVQHRRISFHTRDNGDIRYFDMSSFDFSCNTPVKVLDIQAELSGNVADDFIDYTYELNRDLIARTVDAPEEALDALAHYPETTECVDACALDIEHKKIRYAKLSKAKKVVLKITGDEDFDIYSQIHPGPLAWSKKFFNRKKNRLKVRAIVPAGLRPGTVPIWVGNCFGEIEVLP
jgi:penicillin V acylase-like amidase (Ntn superfamily)